MRCSTERQVESDAQDPYGQSIRTTATPLTAAPCYWQAQRERFVADGDKVVAVAEHLMLLPLTSDIREQDHVTAITDRRGRSLKSTRLRVMDVIRRETYQEVMLEEYA